MGSGANLAANSGRSPVGMRRRSLSCTYCDQPRSGHAAAGLAYSDVACRSGRRLLSATHFKTVLSALPCSVSATSITRCCHAAIVKTREFGAVGKERPGGDPLLPRGYHSTWHSTYPMRKKITRLPTIILTPIFAHRFILPPPGFFMSATSMTRCCCCVIVKTREFRAIEKDRLAGGPLLHEEYQRHATFVV
jgi:hypothetical protein